jgi:molybdate transport system regulatory protein
MRPKKNKPCAVLVRPRIYIDDGIAIGPGKIDLLRAVGETRSIAAAARSVGVPYKRAWLLIDSLNVGFGSPVVETATGGKGGGGASLTALGQQLVTAYDAREKRLNTEAAPELEALRQLADCSPS